MASSILGVGQSALAAAQAGLSTTAHNIANASTPGYSRQVVVQGSAGAQDFGYGFVGKGTTVATVRRVYSDLLASQVRSSQTTTNELSTYYTQISRINNQLAGATGGLSSSLDDFFGGIQDLASNPGTASSRQAALSSAEALAARFRGLDNQVEEMASAVNTQIESSITSINAYAAQIAKLNDAIEKAQAGTDKVSNDLLDQRDLAITELSKEIQTTVVKQGESYNVFIGSGQPLVVGTTKFGLTAIASETDASRLEVGYTTNGNVVELSESSMTGGKLGGLFQFRSEMLDLTRNSLGRVALGLATTFNEQHRLGIDQNGDLGGDFFVAAAPRVDRGSKNDSTSAADVGAVINDVSKLTTSDYRLQMSGGNYVITRLSDNAQVYSDAAFPAAADIIPGMTLTLDSGGFTEGDQFVIRPTADAASKFEVAIGDVSKIAAAAPVVTSVSTGNHGSGAISAGTVNDATDANLMANVTITFTSATTFDVSGTGTGDPTGLAYTEGGDITYNGWTIKITGTPAAGDTFTIGPNASGKGDNRNALLLASLQTAKTLADGTTTYQGAYAQLASAVGNKTRELEVTSKAEAGYLAQAEEAQQAESGVNLDEEAANILRYQQAYSAAAKVMQTANQLFELLLSMGN